MTHRTKTHGVASAIAHTLKARKVSSGSTDFTTRVASALNGPFLYLGAICIGIVWASIGPSYRSGFLFVALFVALIAIAVIFHVGDRHFFSDIKQRSKLVRTAAWLMAVLVGLVGLVANDRFSSKQELTSLQAINWDREFVSIVDNRYKVVKVDAPQAVAASLGLASAKDYQEVIAKLRFMEISPATDSGSSRNLRSVKIVSKTDNAQAELAKRDGTLLLIVDAPDQGSAQRAEDAAKRKFSVEDHPFYRMAASLKAVFRRPTTSAAVATN